MRIIALARILILSIGFTISMIVFQVFYSGSFMYLFFVWNIFLAGMPLLFSSFLIQTENKIVQYLLFAAWLLFFPNALYIVTDLIHLKERYGVPFWFDIILVFSAAVNGLILGYTSLQHIELFFLSKFSNRVKSILIFFCLLISSFGVYLGRFLRWNSWDAIANPLQLFFGITQRIANPLYHPRTWGLTILLTAFSMIFYLTIKKLSGLNIKSSQQ
jgi:uncharacterized membrane protein